MLHSLLDYSVILVGLLPRGSAEVRPIEVVVAAGVLLAVLFQLRLVSSQCGLSQLEWLFALF